MAQLEEMIGDAELATVDAKDSLSSLRTMKECGPPVIEHMVEMLKSASNMIPVRHMRGSVSQLLPRLIWPLVTGRSPLRLLSFDWQSKTCKTRVSLLFRDFQKDLVSGTLNNYQISPGPSEPGHTVQETEKGATSFVPDAKTIGDSASERSSNPSQGGMFISVGNDGSGNCGAMNDNSVGTPSHYVRAVIDSAFSTAETVTREGAKLLRRGAEYESGDGRLKSLLGFGRKAQKMTEEDNGELQHVESGTSSENPRQVEDNFEQFKAEHAAKLEM